jgi:hypothetical protein
MDISTLRRENAYNGVPVAARVRVRHWVLGVLFIVAGAVVAAGAFSRVASGPRVGISTALIVIGALVVAVPLSVWVLRKTTRPEDYVGNCPVGRVCPACDAFNMNPRTTCRACGAALGGRDVARTASKEPL